MRESFNLKQLLCSARSATNKLTESLKEMIKEYNSTNYCKVFPDDFVKIIWSIEYRGMTVLQTNNFSLLYQISDKPDFRLSDETTYLLCHKILIRHVVHVGNKTSDNKQDQNNSSPSCRMLVTWCFTSTTLENWKISTPFFTVTLNSNSSMNSSGRN